MSTNDSIVTIDTVIASRDRIAAADTPYIDGWSARRELLEAIDEFVRRDAAYKQLEASEVNNGANDDSDELQDAKIERSNALEDLRGVVREASDWLKRVLAPSVQIVRAHVLGAGERSPIRANRVAFAIVQTASGEVDCYVSLDDPRVRQIPAEAGDEGAIIRAMILHLTDDGREPLEGFAEYEKTLDDPFLGY